MTKRFTSCVLKIIISYFISFLPFYYVDAFVNRLMLCPVRNLFRLRKNILSITENEIKFGNYEGWTSMTENQWQQVKKDKVNFKFLLFSNFVFRVRKVSISYYAYNLECGTILVYFSFASVERWMELPSGYGMVKLFGKGTGTYQRSTEV